MSRLFGALAGVLILVAFPASAAELVMFETVGCPWCKQWNEEVGRIYDKTDEAKVVPLRRVDMEGPRPADLAMVGGIVYSPTFIVLEKGVEIGRIQGYPGEDSFWWMLDNIIERLHRLRKVGFPPPSPLGSGPPSRPAHEVEPKPAPPFLSPESGAFLVD